MNKHVEKAMELRNETPMVNNCAQTIMRVYADELGIDENLCAAIGCNFGGGMKCGGTCGAITAGLMVLGAKGVDSPMAVQQFRKEIAEKHDGMTDCADLLRANAQKGGDKKTHCDKMSQEAIELAEYIRDLGYMPEQVQDFYPTPSTLSTCMYYTGLDPRTMEKVYTPVSPHEKAMQRALIQYRNPENYELVKEALLKNHREDLIGFDRHCLIPPRPMKNGYHTGGTNQGNSKQGSPKQGSQKKGKYTITQNTRTSRQHPAGQKPADNRKSGRSGTRKAGGRKR